MELLHAADALCTVESLSAVEALVLGRPVLVLNTPTNLRELVEASGGRVIELTGPDDAERAFAEVLAELREQYVIGYYPANAVGDGSWHRVEVRVEGSGLDVRSRTGYYDD